MKKKRSDPNLEEGNQSMKRVKTQKRNFNDSLLGLFVCKGNSVLTWNEAEIRNLITGNCIATAAFPQIIPFGIQDPKVDLACSKVLTRHSDSTLVWDIKSNTVSSNEGEIRGNVVFNHRGTQYLDVHSQTVRETEGGIGAGQYAPPAEVDTNPPWYRNIFGSRPATYRGNCCFSGDDSKVIFANFASHRNRNVLPGIIVWDVTTGEALRKFEEHRTCWAHVACPVDREIVVSVDDHDMMVWNYNDCTTILRLPLDMIKVCNLVLCRSLNAACIQHQKGLTVLDLETGAVVSECTKHSANWKHLRYCEGENVFIQGMDNGARVVDACSGKILFVAGYDIRVERLAAIGCLQTSQVVLL